VGGEEKEDSRKEKKQLDLQPEVPKEESGQTRKMQHHPDQEDEGKNNPTGRRRTNQTSNQVISKSPQRTIFSKL
jgi:hypothetical protein